MTRRIYQLSQDMADMYLTKNGLPITNAQNTQYKGASKDIYDIFTDRDPRMYHAVTPHLTLSFREVPINRLRNPNCSWGYDTRDPKYRKFIDIMGQM
ncbi:MAG: RagB/SusD family nutrient uptake outer membrane protein [Phocaeicola vulgatus]